jgi:hypothetical protein
LENDKHNEIKLQMKLEQKEKDNLLALEQIRHAEELEAKKRAEVQAR